MHLDGHVLPEGEVRGGVLGVVAVGLSLLRAVDATEADVLRLLVVQDFDGGVVKDGDDGVVKSTKEESGKRRRTKHVSSSRVTMPSLGG